ncbi:MAG: nuclear transport factor 2 family protein [Myxococcales bacterium]|nr:nuclear transport factor 2 family protein [Myxococcales bacterium]MCB9521787.1 nuclear transport factor 2 family protein [Myxococcales bacterium]
MGVFRMWAVAGGLLAVVSTGTLTGCGPRYVTNTEIEYTEPKQALANLVERYRVAMEQRDADAIRALVSRRYYENGSTTNDPADDYDYAGLNKVLADLENHVKAVKYEIEIQAIDVYEDTATVDYEYHSQFMYAVGPQDRWSTAADRNRLTFRKEHGDWRIVSGL